MNWRSNGKGKVAWGDPALQGAGQQGYWVAAEQHRLCRLPVLKHIRPWHAPTAFPRLSGFPAQGGWPQHPSPQWMVGCVAPHDTGEIAGKGQPVAAQERPQPWFSWPLFAPAPGHARVKHSWGLLPQVTAKTLLWTWGCSILGVRATLLQPTRQPALILQAPTQQRMRLRGSGELVLTLHNEVGCFC